MTIHFSLKTKIINKNPDKSIIFQILISSSWTMKNITKIGKKLLYNLSDFCFNIISKKNVPKVLSLKISCLIFSNNFKNLLCKIQYHALWSIFFLGQLAILFKTFFLVSKQRKCFICKFKQTKLRKEQCDTNKRFLKKIIRHLKSFFFDSFFICSNPNNIILLNIHSVN